MACCDRQPEADEFRLQSPLNVLWGIETAARRLGISTDEAIRMQRSGRFAPPHCRSRRDRRRYLYAPETIDAFGLRHGYVLRDLSPIPETTK
jgi:hypothetical protein